MAIKKGLICTDSALQNGVYPYTQTDCVFDANSNDLDTLLSAKLDTTTAETMLDEKMDLVASPTNAHVLTTDANGQAVDSGTALSTLTGKMDLVSSPTNGHLLTTNASGQAVDSATTVNNLKVLVITSSSFSSLPQTISNSSITAKHVVVNSTLSNPPAQTGDWTVSTAAGSLTIGGSISGSTTITLYLAMSI